jgi:hypothetical protein
VFGSNKTKGANDSQMFDYPGVADYDLMSFKFNNRGLCIKNNSNVRIGGR